MRDLLDLFSGMLSTNLQRGGRLLFKWQDGAYVVALKRPDDQGTLVGRGPSLYEAASRLAKAFVDEAMKR